MMLYSIYQAASICASASPHCRSCAQDGLNFERQLPLRHHADTRARVTITE
jgi:hypothetical protein